MSFSASDSGERKQTITDSKSEKESDKDKLIKLIKLYKESIDKIKKHINEKNHTDLSNLHRLLDIAWGKYDPQQNEDRNQMGYSS